MNLVAEIATLAGNERAMSRTIQETNCPHFQADKSSSFSQCSLAWLGVRLVLSSPLYKQIRVPQLFLQDPEHVVLSVDGMLVVY